MDDSEIYSSEKRFVPTVEMIQMYQDNVGELYGASRIALLAIDKKLDLTEDRGATRDRISSYISELPEKDKRGLVSRDVVEKGLELYGRWDTYAKEHPLSGLILDEADDYKKAGFTAVVDILRTVSISNPGMIHAFLKNDSHRTFDTLGDALLEVGNALHGSVEESEDIVAMNESDGTGVLVGLAVEPGESAVDYYKDQALAFIRPYITDIVMKSDYHKNVN